MLTTQAKKIDISENKANRCYDAFTDKCEVIILS